MPLVGRHCRVGRLHHRRCVVVGCWSAGRQKNVHLNASKYMILRPFYGYGTPLLDKPNNKKPEVHGLQEDKTRALDTQFSARCAQCMAVFLVCDLFGG